MKLKNYTYSNQFKLNTQMSFRDLFKKIAQKTPATAASNLLMNKEASQAFQPMERTISFGAEPKPQEEASRIKQ